MPSALPSAVVCGPQTILPPQQSIEHLQNHLTNDADLRDLHQAFLELPALLSQLQANDTRLNQISPSPLNDLRNWALDNGCALEVPEALPNILLAPLTILIHIVQYIGYLDRLPSDDAHAHIREATHHGGFQGLCTGSLSAAALACSSTRREIGQHAAIALKLAMCIGAYVDMGQISEVDSTMTCFIARWGARSQREHVEQILSHYSQVCFITIANYAPESNRYSLLKAYVSVEVDECSATITAPEADFPALRSDFLGKSIQLAKVQVNGRYHAKENKSALQNLLKFCKSEPTLRFPAIDDLSVPWRNNTTGMVETGAHQLHEVCLQSILTEPASWYLTMSETVNSIVSTSPDDSSIILELGLVGCVPPSLAGSPHLTTIRATGPNETQQNRESHEYSYPDQCVAIVGAACKYPGAESLDELWKLVSMAQSMDGKVPHQRYDPADLRQGPPQAKDLNGNFVSGVDQFDYAFFGISPREAMYMDPQQRIALQVAYRAVESSGYFGHESQHTDFGCYLGVGGSDYEHNVNAHNPTAFSFIGTSRAFISGRISHFFKWTGPSITIDTACSSSAVAIHQACRDILSGDCSMALAGGINIMSSPTTHQNLATANFLNSTGTPCRSFDSAGNGYSRGEGCGLIVLKKLSAAIADGDHILSVIAATATNQSDGSSSITVPVSKSQVSLYGRALSRAAMTPRDISYVEAHGTGTPRGDPIEWRSIYEVFGKDRNNKVHVGSIKANIGHTEAASGVAGVLKLLTMLRHEQLPPQANFASLNTTIPYEQQDNMAMSTKSRKWNTGFRAACVNNYGAAGNNTVIIVCQPPSTKIAKTIERNGKGKQTLARYPILISGKSTASLKRNCAAIAHFIGTERPALADVAFNLARRQNRSLRHQIAFDASSLADLQHRLEYPNQLDPNSLVSGDKVKPVILVFGGQTGVTVHLRKAVYDTFGLLRKYLDHCDSLIQEMGLPSLFPGIFSQIPISDVVSLHCAFFAVQYACAATWLDLGLRVQRVIGHSFGQLTAMCVSGVITLPDALKLVSGRAKLIKSEWGSEKGAMLSIKADRVTALTLTQSEANLGLEIACFNGPTSHVLVGSEAAIDAVASQTSGLKMRKLNTSHGFHSRYIDSFLDKYLDLTRSISYSTPTIPIETCSESTSWEIFTAELVAEHSRKPVYFVDAVHRIKEQLGSCIWLEAGSGSSGVTLTKDALGGNDSDSFYGLQLGSADPMQSVVDTTLRLWKERVSVQFWKYHPVESPLFNALDLPGYQFDETSHWLPRVERVHAESIPGMEPSLISLASLSSPEHHVSRFDINQLTPGIAEILRGREVLGGSLWPLSLYIELTSKAVALLTPGLPWEFQRVRLENFEIQAPLGSKLIPHLGLRLKQLEGWTWEWSLEGQTSTQNVPHATGKIILEDQRAGSALQRAFPGIIDYEHCRGLLNDATAFSATGSIAYKLLEKVAEYDPSYQGIESLKMSEHEATAQISMPQAARDWVKRESINPILLDQFTMVAEIHALAMIKCKRSEVFTCSGVREMVVHKSGPSASRSSWTVYTRQSTTQGRVIYYDTYVFDPATGSLVLSVLGAKFVKVASHVLERVIERANIAGENIEPIPEIKPPVTAPAHELDHLPTLEPKTHSPANVWSTTAQFVHELTGFPLEQITTSTILAEIGMDSLAATDLEYKIKEAFEVDINVQVSDDGGNFGSLIDLIQPQGGSRQTDDTDSSDSSSPFTPTAGSSSPSSDVESISIASDTMIKLSGIVAEYLGSADTVHPDTQLLSLGLDSLVAMELESELFQTFGLEVSLMRLCETVTINDLHDLLVQSGLVPTAKQPAGLNISSSARDNSQAVHFVDQAAGRFANARENIGVHAQEADFAGFFERVSPKQMSLVLAYVTEAFAALGCDLSVIPPQAPVPGICHIAKHNDVVAYYYDLLHEAGLITHSESGFIRTSQPLKQIDVSSLYHEIVENFPRHRSEHKLLHRTGAQLANCLSGKADALRLLFCDKATGDLLQDVYTNAPMFKMGTLMLGHFLPQALASSSATATEPFRILELGAGTGGTTRFILDQLVTQGVPIRYTFTDISAALVSRARNTFSAYDCIEYMTMNVEQIPPEAIGSYDLILSSNCIHATKDLRHSCRGLYDLLRPKGMLCLLELTQDVPWLDLTFGLLDGWWRFEDGRKHVLASEQLWKQLLTEAGFGHVDWSNDKTRESDVFRLIMALKQ